MKKTVSFTREAALVGSEPKDSWEVLNCSPAEAVDMAMRLLGQVTRVLQTVNEQQIQEQQQIIKGLVNERVDDRHLRRIVGASLRRDGNFSAHGWTSHLHLALPTACMSFGRIIAVKLPDW